MEPLNSAIERFFREFERLSDTGDFPAVLHQFADTFMAAGPQGAQCVRATDFALALPKRKQFFDSLGCRSTALVSLHPHPIDERYVMAKTQWRMTFARDHGETKDVLADSVFIVDTSVEGFRIVFYLANQDHMSMLRKNGILPDSGPAT